MVFGYYIEVSNSFKDQVPDTYIRKQTLVNGERYITQELKDLEQEILTAGERDNALEYEIFSALRDEDLRGRPSASRRPPPRSRSLTRSRRLPSSRSKTATAARWWTIPA